MNLVGGVKIISNNLLGLNKKLYHTNRLTKKGIFQGSKCNQIFIMACFSRVWITNELDKQRESLVS